MSSTFIKLPKVSGGGGGGGAVDSFNGRVGSVVSQVGDYSAGTISNTPAGTISSTNVQGAINELDTEKQTIITGAATTITSANLTTSRVLESDVSGKVAVSAITSTQLSQLSGVTSNVQTQLDNKQPLDSDLTAIAALVAPGFVAKTGVGTATVRSIQGTAGQITVVNGDGVAANPTLSLNVTGVTPGVYTNPDINVDAQGRITSISSSVAPPFDPDLVIEIKDDFTSASPTSGAYGFALANSGAGANTTITNTGVNITQKAIGVAQMTNGTTTTGRTALSTSTLSFTTTYCSYDARSRFWLTSAGDVTNQFEFTFGLLNNLGAGLDHTNGAYFRFYGNGVNVFWQIVTASGGIRTTTTTSTAMLINNPEIFQVTINEAATAAEFYINGILVGTHNTNIPTAVQQFAYGWRLLKNGGTTASFALIDWAYLKCNFSAPRG